MFDVVNIVERELSFFQNVLTGPVQTKGFVNLPDFLYIVHSDRKPFGIVLTKIATDTGNFTVH